MLGRTLAALGVIAAFMTTSAHAAVIQERGPLLSATNGIALGPDGNIWVAEEFNGSVVRMTQGGSVLNRYSVGGNPTSVASGPDGRVWVTIPNANKLVWFDATSGTPTAHDGPTALLCGPVAIENGGDGNMYFSLPACGRLGYMTGSGGNVMTAAGFGQVYDLAVSNGKLFAPDAGNDAVRRVALGPALTPEASLGANGGPDGITADGTGNLWVTFFNTGHVGRFAATQNLGTVPDITPSGGTLSSPFGIVAGNDGRIYVTGKDSKNIARVDSSGSNWQFFATDGEPWQIINGTDGDLFFTDQSSTRILRFLSGPPRASTGAASPVAGTAGSASASVDTRGNVTSVVFDYGPTAAYGATTAPVTLPAGDGGTPVTVVLSALAAGTTYHVRVRATNEEGSAAGADTTFSTPAPPPVPLKVLAARATFGWSFVGSRTALRKVEIGGLAGGETAKVTCKGKGCPFKTKTYKNLKKGKKSLSSRFGLKRKLAKGAKVTILVTKPGTIGTNAVVTIRGRKQDPKITRTCLQPGAKKTSRCPT